MAGCRLQTRLATAVFHAVHDPAAVGRRAPRVAVLAAAAVVGVGQGVPKHSALPLTLPVPANVVLGAIGIVLTGMVLFSRAMRPASAPHLQVGRIHPGPAGSPATAGVREGIKPPVGRAAVVRAEFPGWDPSHEGPHADRAPCSRSAVFVTEAVPHADVVVAAKPPRTVVDELAAVPFPPDHFDATAQGTRGIFGVHVDVAGRVS
jgi:hypothetical protein